MRKLLVATVSAFALAIAFGSAASADPHHDSNILLDTDSKPIKKLDNSIMGNNNLQTGVQDNALASVITRATAIQNITQINTNLSVHINAGGKM